ncbi:hypothetical protein KKE60_08850 [Patescibacteria group bacterium]|nr:hypothetical protein [Patescibacteria group bacterium]
MSAIIVKALRRVGLGSFTGIVLYLFIAITALAAFSTYTALFALGTEDWAWFTLGNISAWSVLNNPDRLAPTFSIARIVLPICIGLIIAIWEVMYIFGSEEVNWALAFTVAMLGALVIILSQVIWSVL